MNDDDEICPIATPRAAAKGLFWRVILPGAIFLGAIGLGAILYVTGPEAPKKPPRPTSRPVEVIRLTPTDHALTLQAMGNVIPAQQVEMKSRVSGTVVEISPALIPGGVLKAGEMLIRLDPTDFALIVEQRQADLARAEQDQQLELGRQAVAKHEWQLLKGREASEQEKSLALRVPQLKRAEADLAAARATLRRAELDLERTTVTAPFDAQVRERFVDLGAQVTSQTPVASLLGEGALWVDAAIPLEVLTWLDLPNDPKATHPAVEVTIAGATGDGCWRGTVLREQPELEERGRLAQLLVEVSPRSVEGGRHLPVGAYVDVAITGRRLTKVMVFPRSALRDDDTVWLLEPLAEKKHEEDAAPKSEKGADEEQKKQGKKAQAPHLEGKLVRLAVEPIWKDRQVVIVAQGLTAGQLLITSDLSAPVPGMAIWCAPLEDTPHE